MDNKQLIEKAFNSVTAFGLLIFTIGLTLPLITNNPLIIFSFISNGLILLLTAVFIGMYKDKHLNRLRR